MNNMCVHIYTRTICVCTYIHIYINNMYVHIYIFTYIYNLAVKALFLARSHAYMYVPLP